ncbi:thiolase family protein [Flavonifractor sp. An306]|uniref:thiolase family protein n=1 Tax=Flavonifractor sp. An306 TaxID=1965629 RepID=UPI001748956B|nr:thiolase family protein [Flavonifractor sp. An306]
MNQHEAVIVAYGRSGVTKAYKGGLAKVHPVSFATETLKGVLARVPQLDPKEIDDVIVGCANPEGTQGWNMARLITQLAGLPKEVSAQTVNRFCSSGMQTIATAANAIIANQCDVVVAGGVESMTRIKNMFLEEEFRDPALVKSYNEAYMAPGYTAERVAQKCGITRQEMDEFAVRSHALAAAAQDVGAFDDQIIPIHGVGPDGADVLVDKDEGVRRGTSLEGLASLKPCFEGIVTAGTSSQMSDGAAFVVLMSREKAETLGIAPIARFVGFAVAGCESEYMGLGPIYAVPKVFRRTGITLDQIDTIELNEAFAAQAIPCIRTLGFDLNKVNPEGGAIALGHPLGATGAVLTCKALSRLRRQEGRYALITMCIGGGQGAAGIFERL